MYTHTHTHLSLSLSLSLTHTQTHTHTYNPDLAMEAAEVTLHAVHDTKQVTCPQPSFPQRSNLRRRVTTHGLRSLFVFVYFFF